MIMLERALDPCSRDHIVNGTDDFTGFCGHSVDESSGEVTVDWKGLAHSFIAMVELADKSNMSLKATKTFFGSTSTKYWGHTLKKDGHRATIHNLFPIRKLVVPTNVS